jgi:hypothetical protein
MPKARWIDWEGCRWRLTDLAIVNGLKPQTLAARIDRGYPLARALATGLCSLEEAGRRGARHCRISSWP